VDFNTIRTWMDWATGEPKQGEYHFENLDMILELANEEGCNGGSRAEVSVK
jgi:beta-galactosidase